MEEQKKVFVTYKGQELELPGFDRSDFRAAADHVAKIRKDPLNAILPHLDKLKQFPALQQHLVDAAYKDLRKDGDGKPSAADVGEWLDTVDGILWSLGYCMRKKHPNITEEEVVELFQTTEPRILMAKRDEASRQLIAETNGVATPAHAQPVKQAG